MSDSLASAHDELYAALAAMLAGDAEPICALWSDQDDISYAGPFGGALVGREAVTANFREVAGWHLVGRIETEGVHMFEGSDLGFSFCTENGIDHMINGELTNITHRATNIFRKEAGGWKLLHHHTDFSAS